MSRIRHKEENIGKISSSRNLNGVLTLVPLVILMLPRQLQPVSTSYSRILRECLETSNLRKAQKVHAHLIRKTSDVASDALFIHNHLMNVYVRCGDVESAVQLFEEMPEKNVVSWSILIAGFARKGLPVRAVSLFSEMHTSSVRPNEYTFVSTLQACSSSENLDLICALQVYVLIIRLGFANNMFLLNAFSTALIRHGLLDQALREFEGHSNTDTVAWNAIFDGFLKFRTNDIPGFFKRMISEGINPDEFTFATVLTGMSDLSNLEMGLQVHARLVKSGGGSEKCVGNALVDMYLKNHRLGDGFGAFNEIPVKDVCSWTQLATGCLNCGKPVEALWVIREMRMTGIMLNKFTLATGLNACANLSSLEEGQKLQCLMIKLGDEVDVCVYNALLDLFAKCGCMDWASRVFRAMNEHSVVSWTTMIMGYAQNGHAEEAMTLFQEMICKGAKPNHITFICLLYACSQGGYIDNGLAYFSSMSNKYGIIPSEDHYICMIHLLGQAGRIKEAEELILEMPFRPSKLVWQTLLGACRLHGDVETAKRAAECAFAADDENDSSTYVLLYNTFADIENWRIAGTLMEWIRNKDIKKHPGTSWVQTIARSNI